MSGIDLCSTGIAKKPFLIESIRLKIYSIEELCYFICHNRYLLDEYVFNQTLCDWIREEMQNGKLARRMQELIRQHAAASDMVVPILRQVGYMPLKEIDILQKKISSWEIQPLDIRRKMRADALVSYEMFCSAVSEYEAILERKNPSAMGVQFYGTVYHNLAAAYGRQFLFDQALESLEMAYSMLQSEDILKRYLQLCRFYKGEEEARESGKRIGMDAQRIEQLLEKSDAVFSEKAARSLDAECANSNTKELTKKMKQKYRKSL